MAGWGGMVVVGWERDCRCGGGYESRSSMSSSSSSLTRTKRGDLRLQQVQKVVCEERMNQRAEQRASEKCEERTRLATLDRELTSNDRRRAGYCQTSTAPRCGTVSCSDCARAVTLRVREANENGIVCCLCPVLEGETAPPMVDGSCFARTSRGGWVAARCGRADGRGMVG